MFYLILLCFVLLFSNYAAAATTYDPLSDSVTIILSVKGEQFKINFPANEVDAQEMASRFCVAKSNLFGISSDVNTEDFKEKCLVPISNYLVKEVQQVKLKEKEKLKRENGNKGGGKGRSVRVAIADKNYDISLEDTTTSAARQAALKFCHEHPNLVTDMNEIEKLCIEPIFQVLNGAILGESQ